MIADFPYAAGSPDCRLYVAVRVLVVVKHIAMATLILRTCITRDYSLSRLQSQGFSCVAETEVPDPRLAFIFMGLTVQRRTLPQGCLEASP